MTGFDSPGLILLSVTGRGNKNCNLKFISWFGNAMQYQGHAGERTRSAFQVKEDDRLANTLSGPNGHWLLKPQLTTGKSTLADGKSSQVDPCLGVGFGPKTEGICFRIRTREIVFRT
jgi:hypothetical protein